MNRHNSEMISLTILSDICLHCCVSQYVGRHDEWWVYMECSPNKLCPFSSGLITYIKYIIFTSAYYMRDNEYQINELNIETLVVYIAMDIIEK